MLSSTAVYPSGTQPPPPLSTNADSIYTTNGASANKGLFCIFNYSLEFIARYFLKIIGPRPAPMMNRFVECSWGNSPYSIFDCRSTTGRIPIVIFSIHLLQQNHWVRSEKFVFNLFPFFRLRSSEWFSFNNFSKLILLDHHTIKWNSSFSVSTTNNQWFDLFR